MAQSAILYFRMYGNETPTLPAEDLSTFKLIAHRAILKLLSEALGIKFRKWAAYALATLIFAHRLWRQRESTNTESLLYA